MGRRIGYNWWREMNCSILFEADVTWLKRREAECNGWKTEEREFQMLHPRPTLKAFLLANAGMHREPEREEDVA